MMGGADVMGSLRAWVSPEGHSANNELTTCRTPWRAMNPASDLALDHLQLEFGNGLGGIEALRASLNAVHDGMTTIEPEWILEIVEPLAGGFIAAVLDPAVRLQQCGRAEITIAVPPIARAGGRAAGAQDAFVEPVELFAVLVAVPPFLVRCRRAGLRTRHH